MAEGTDEGLGGVLLVGEAKRREPDQSRGTVRHTGGCSSTQTKTGKETVFVF